MAIITFGMTRCPLCEQLLIEGDKIVSTSHFMPFGHPYRLWRCSDAAMHKSCFLAWEDREEFIKIYNQVQSSQGQPRRMIEDGEIVVPGETKAEKKDRLRKQQHSYKWNERRARKDKRRFRDDTE